MFNTSKIQSESNSQLLEDDQAKKYMLCSIRQRYNLKAIHNFEMPSPNTGVAVFNTSKIQSESNSQRLRLTAFTDEAVFNTSKIQSESNSQLGLALAIISLRCVQYVKDTI